MSLVLIGCATSDDLPAIDEGPSRTFLPRGLRLQPLRSGRAGAASVEMSYPIFAELYNTPVFRGQEAVRRFAERFCSRWKEAQFTFHESLADGDNVVLVWSFRARFVGSESPGGPVPGEEQGWGGITLYQFDDSGQIAAGSERARKATAGRVTS